MKLFVIGAFGVMGVLTRYVLEARVSRLLMQPFPWGTFLINVVGSLLIGVIYVLGVEKFALSEELRLGLMVGFLGGFTTFSSYALESFLLFERGEFLAAALYFLLSPVLGIAAVGMALFLSRWFFLKGVV